MESKKCWRCKETKSLIEFWKGSVECKPCKRELSKKYMKVYRSKHREEIRKRNKAYHKHSPWTRKLYHIKRRCNYPDTYYFKKGIKCLLTSEEIKKLWFRDKAWLLEQPSVDRIDPQQNYIFSNCRFIEMKENREKRFKQDKFNLLLLNKIKEKYPEVISECIKLINA